MPKSIIINKNALFKEMVNKHGKHHTYLALSNAIDGSEETLTRQEADQLLDVIEKEFRTIKTNVKNSIIKK